MEIRLDYKGYIKYKGLKSPALNCLLTKAKEFSIPF